MPCKAEAELSRADPDLKLVSLPIALGLPGSSSVPGLPGPAIIETALILRGCCGTSGTCITVTLRPEEDDGMLEPPEACSSSDTSSGFWRKLAGTERRESTGCGRGMTVVSLVFDSGLFTLVLKPRSFIIIIVARLVTLERAFVELEGTAPPPLAWTVGALVQVNLGSLVIRLSFKRRLAPCSSGSRISWMSSGASHKA
mmetsp:Transcript_48258/g.103474  ORF Transcript_48258/g.103474 Transcript_48258/m.103474 type:complete len:199 (-) Transcript_48258:985-1581(-)